jgi:hypothetical protein
MVLGAARSSSLNAGLAPTHDLLAAGVAAGPFPMVAFFLPSRNSRITSASSMAEEFDYVPMPASVVTSIEKVWQDEIKDANAKTALHRNALNIQSEGGRAMRPSRRAQC